MSVSNENTRISFTASGGQTVFNFTNILIFESSDLKVYKNGVLQNPSSYTVTLSGTAPADGFITLFNGATAGDTWIIERDILLTQPTTYNPGTAFPAKSHENALDRRALSDNDLALEARYSPKFNRGKDENIDWTYTNLPNQTDPRLPVFDPVSKSIVWVASSILDAISGGGGLPASVDFSNLTGTLDISGADSRVLDITVPYGGAVPLSLTERWQNWYTVKDFGAVGDDVADDSTAFTNCDSAAGLGWVYVPSGTYKLSNNVTLKNVVISTGAIIKPDAGKTLTITGGIVTGFSQIFDGAGSIKISKQRPIYTEWFGAVADGLTDNIAAFNKAVSACENNTCSIQLLNGTYAIGSTWTISLEGASIAGMGRDNTVISSSFASGNDIVLSSANANYLGDFKIQPSVSKSSGAAINVSSAGTNIDSEFVGLSIVNPFTGFEFVRAKGWLIHHCRIVNPTTGISVENQADPTTSNGRIVNSFITKSGSTGTAIKHISGGGLSLENVKVTGFLNQYHLVPGATVTASNVFIIGCSLSGGSKGIVLDRAASTGAWSGININGNNIFDMSSAGIHVGNTVASWLSNVNIGSNVIRVPASAIGVDLDGQDSILVDNNVFNGVSGTTVGIDNNASSTNVVIGDDNLFNNITTDILPVPTPTPPLLFTGSKTHDFPSVAFEDEANTTVTVTGAEPGMIAFAQISTMNNLNALLVAYVSASNTVTVALHNISDATPIDLASGTLIAYVINPAGLL